MLVYVHTPFILNINNEKIHYQIGEQDIPEDQAIHPYSSVHLSLTLDQPVIEDSDVQLILNEVEIINSETEKPKRAYRKKNDI